MRSTLFISNVGYSALKKQAGLHNWGFISNHDPFEFDADELDAFLNGLKDPFDPTGNARYNQELAS